MKYIPYRVTKSLDKEIQNKYKVTITFVKHISSPNF